MTKICPAGHPNFDEAVSCSREECGLPLGGEHVVKVDPFAKLYDNDQRFNIHWSPGEEPPRLPSTADKSPAVRRALEMIETPEERLLRNLREKQPTPKQCSNCSHVENDPEASYCCRCGTKLPERVVSETYLYDKKREFRDSTDKNPEPINRSRLENYSAQEKPFSYLKVCAKCGQRYTLFFAECPQGGYHSPTSEARSWGKEA